MCFFEKLKGYDDEVASNFSLSLIPLTRTHSIFVVKGLSIELTPKIIGRISTLPLAVPWRKDDKGNSQTAKKKLFLK